MKNAYKVLVAVFLVLCAFNAKAQECKVGFVNVKLSVEKSKYGQQEKEAFETLKKQLGANLEKTDKELGDLSKKLEDKDFLEGISSGAQEELKQKFQKLSQEFVRYQNQYYQLLQQANYKMLQNLNDIICKASEKVRESMKLDFVLNDDSAFAFAPSLDVTDDVVRDMDIRFERDNADKGK